MFSIPSFDILTQKIRVKYAVFILELQIIHFHLK